MGGLLALYFAKKHGHSLPNFKGVITSAPAVAPYHCPAWAYYASKLLGNGCLARFQDKNQLDLKNLSRDPEIEVKYNADPLVHGWITLQTARDLIVYGEEMLESAHEFTYSILSLHGTDDKMTSFGANEKFMQRCGSTDKTFEPKKGFYHERK
jgi:alpha-beta hydrolase superfamily lysophospholipase